MHIVSGHVAKWEHWDAMSSHGTIFCTVSCSNLSVLIFLRQEGLDRVQTASSV